MVNLISDSEIISSEDIEYIIEFNRQKVEESGENKDVYFEEVNRHLLEGVFKHMDSYNNISDGRQRIIKKATHILTGVIRPQPFFEGNKRTAVATAYTPILKEMD